jgi:hypothetical protein
MQGNMRGAASYVTHGGEKSGDVAAGEARKLGSGGLLYRYKRFMICYGFTNYMDLTREKKEYMCYIS